MGNYAQSVVGYGFMTDGDSEDIDESVYKISRIVKVNDASHYDGGKVLVGVKIHRGHVHEGKVNASFDMPTLEEIEEIKKVRDAIDETAVIKWHFAFFWS